MVDIVVNPITQLDRDRWAELWRGYLDFYETRLPTRRSMSTPGSG